MKKSVFTIVLLLALAVSGFAQVKTTPEDFVAVGASWNQFASPQVNGLMAYAHKIADNDGKPTYSFSAVRFLSVQKSPFRLGTTTETGIAQYLQKFGPFRVYGLVQGGLAYIPTADGTDIGAAVSGGVLTQADLGKGFTVGPFVQITKPGSEEKQWAAGVIFGFGQ